jgi:cytochrome o ubiquinol oxidase operon protein cyoD
VSALRAYITGFILSLLLTIVPYLVVVNHWLSGWLLITALVGLAIGQLLVQLVFFLNLDREARPRWNLLVFLFAALVVVVVVFGSLWIMDNLNYHAMSPIETEQYMHDHDGL